MKRALLIALIVGLFGTAAFAQGLNKIVLGPLEGDDAGVLTVRNGIDIEIEMWVRTDPGNPAEVVGIGHGLLSEDAIIAVRNGVEINPDYDVPNWEMVGVEGPYIYNPADNYPIPQGYTCEMQYAIWCVFGICYNPLDTQGEWEYYGAFLMTCNTRVPVDDTYYPFSMGWYPQNNQSTLWAFDGGGSVIPEQDYCGLYFESEVGIDDEKNIPVEFSPSQNYPNPFNAQTTIEYGLPIASHVVIEIYDLLGNRIITLIDESQEAGHHQVTWNAESQSSGMYFYRVQAGKYVETRKMLLLK